MSMVNGWIAEIKRLQKQIKILELKNSSSLANNLCPDHRDKQAGKSCLACELERLREQNKELLEALKFELKWTLECPNNWSATEQCRRIQAAIARCEK